MVLELFSCYGVPNSLNCCEDELNQITLKLESKKLGDSFCMCSNSVTLCSNSCCHACKWAGVMTLTAQSYARNIHILFWVSLQQLLVNISALNYIWLSISIFKLVCVAFTILWAFNRSCSHLLSWILYLLFDLTGCLFMIMTDKNDILLCCRFPWETK